MTCKEDVCYGSSWMDRPLDERGEKSLIYTIHPTICHILSSHGGSVAPPVPLFPPPLSLSPASSPALWLVDVFIYLCSSLCSSYHFLISLCHWLKRNPTTEGSRIKPTPLSTMWSVAHYCTYTCWNQSV